MYRQVSRRIFSVEGVSISQKYIMFKAFFVFEIFSKGSQRVVKC